MRFLRCISLSLFAVVGIFTCMAQKHYESNVAIGGKAGVSLSRVMFSPTVPQTMYMGATAGFTFRYMEEKHFGLIAELNIVQGGWKETFKGTSYQFSHRLTYIQLPLLTHIYFGSYKVHWFFNAGPQIGYMISDSKSSNFDVNNFSSLTDFPSTNRYTAQFTLPINSKFDYGISAGTGMEFIPKRNNSFLFEVRAYYGLGNVFSSHKKDVFSASSNFSATITLGYLFRLK